MRIYKAFPAYSTYLDLLYKRNPQVRFESFSNQLQFLKDDYFPWVLSWSQFNSDDSVKIFETIHNDSYLQNAWKLDYCRDHMVVDQRIILEQIKRFRPDVCVIYPPELFVTGFLDEIRSVVNAPLLIGGYDGMNRKSADLYKGYDFVITCSPFISDFYSRNSIPTYPLEFGFDSRILSSLNRSRHSYTTSFSGSIFEGIHDDRLDLIKYLINRGIDLTVSSSFEFERHYSLFSRKMLRSLREGSFHEFYDRYRIHNRNIGPLYGKEMFQFLKDSDTTLNLHGDKIDFAANVRLYEATGVGSCLLTDWKKNIADIFEPDKEIITFKTEEEAYDKITFLGKHDSFRKMIAAKAQKRTLSEYTYSNRIPGVIRFIKQLL